MPPLFLDIVLRRSGFAHQRSCRFSKRPEGLPVPEARDDAEAEGGHDEIIKKQE